MNVPGREYFVTEEFPRRGDLMLMRLKAIDNNGSVDLDKELVQYKLVIIGNEGANEWIKVRHFPPIFFDYAK